MTSNVLAVIGGSGLYQMPGLEGIEEVRVDTPWGAPSDAVIKGRLDGTPMLFIPRHGRGHLTPPHAINYRANLWALKMLGATHVVSVSAVGSLREEIAPGDLVVVDQFIDRTRRVGTFFDQGLAVHVSMADPVCPLMAAALHEAASTTDAKVHKGGTYVCIEGPRFSTRAESHMFRAWNAQVVGMTNVPECFLARELELPYATLALSTDYDCWMAHEEAVDVKMVIAVMQKNVAHAQQAIRAIAKRLPDVTKSPAYRVLEHACMTDLGKMDPAVRRKFEPIFAPYWNARA